MTTMGGTAIAHLDAGDHRADSVAHMASLEHADLQDLIAMTYSDWETMNPTAGAYLNALDVSDCHHLTDPVGSEDAATQVRHFLSQASGWKGETARGVKAELRRRLAGETP